MFEGASLEERRRSQSSMRPGSLFAMTLTHVETALRAGVNPVANIRPVSRRQGHPDDVEASRRRIVVHFAISFVLEARGSCSTVNVQNRIFLAGPTCRSSVLKASNPAPSAPLNLHLGGLRDAPVRLSSDKRHGMSLMESARLEVTARIKPTANSGRLFEENKSGRPARFLKWSMGETP